MRFAIAAGILSQALPASSDPTHANILLGASDERKQQIQSLLQEPANRHSDLFSTPKNGRKPTGLSALKRKKPRFKNGALKNEVIIPEDAGACDPSSTADVGLLSCGVGKYCVESQNSKLGGSCVSFTQLTTNRHLQDDNNADRILSDTCDPNSDSYQDIPCECGGFNLTTRTGSIECSYTYGCLVPNCNDTCLDIDISYSKDEEGTTEITYCGELYSPYEQSYCVGYSYSSDGVATNCSVSISDAACASCQLSQDSFSNDSCVIVNCTSVGGLYANFCYGDDDDDEFLLPIFEECIGGGDYYCDICAGGNLTNFYSNVTIPDYGDITCIVLALGGASGIIPESDCPIYQQIAAEPCCDELDIVDTPPPSPDVGTPNPTADPDLFVCQICGEGKAITKPEGVVLIPTQPERTCAEIQAGAEAGDISTVQCPLISSFVQEPCGCKEIIMPTDPPLPTDPPTPTGPTPTNTPAEVNPTDAPLVAPTPAPTDEGSGLLSVKNAASLVGLSIAMVFYFAG